VGPHLTFKYNENDYCIVNDVNKLLLHCLEKAENLRRGEKRKIKVSKLKLSSILLRLMPTRQIALNYFFSFVFRNC